MNWDTKDTPFEGVSTFSKAPSQLMGLWTDKYAYRFVKMSSLVFVPCSLHRRPLALSLLRKGTNHLEDNIEMTVFLYMVDAMSYCIISE